MTSARPDLEKRISAALGNGNAGSADLQDLIVEVEQAAEAAAENACQQRERALDVAVEPDKAHAALVAAELARDRLRTALPRLAERLAGALAAEGHARWLADFQRIQTQRDAAAERFKAVYPEAVQRLVAVLAEAAEIDAELSRINGSAPVNEFRRLSPVELTARELDSFSSTRPSIAKTLVLPEWDESSRMAWPPKSDFMAGMVAAIPKPEYNPRYSPHWWQAAERDQAERAARAAAYDNAERQRKLEERQRYEDAQRRRQA